MSQNTPCPRCGGPREMPGLSSGVTDGLCARCLMALGIDAGTPFIRTGAGAPPPPPTVEDLRAHFPSLTIEAPLGQGGMGTVYRARQTGLDRAVALKILRGDFAEDPAFAERFEREARALARLSHPNIVAVYDAGRAGPYLFLLMEYVDGANLRSVQRAGSLAPAEVLALVQQICDALQYAHDNGIVHRDIKPENILLDGAGKVKIADFGLAKLTGAARGSDFTLTEPAQSLGTLHYMAPEQIEHARDVDHRADIYALGVVFYELLTGELPLGRFQLPSEKVRVDVRLDEVVLKTLAKEPQRRYQAVSEVRTDVSAISDGPATTPPGTGAPSEPQAARASDTRRSGWFRRKRAATAAGDSGGAEAAPPRKPQRRWGCWALTLLLFLFVPCCLGPLLMVPFSGFKATRVAESTGSSSGSSARASARRPARIPEVHIPDVVLPEIPVFPPVEISLGSDPEQASGSDAGERGSSKNPLDLAARLAQSSALDMESGSPRLRARFLADEALTPEEADGIHHALQGGFERYLALEREHTERVALDEPSRVAKRIRGFPGPLQELHDALKAQLAEVVGPRTWAAIQVRLDTESLFPFGRSDALVHIQQLSTSPGESWLIGVGDGAGTRTEQRTEQRTGPIGQPWQRLFEER